MNPVKKFEPMQSFGVLRILEHYGIYYVIKDLSHFFISKKICNDCSTIYTRTHTCKKFCPTCLVSLTLHEHTNHLYRLKKFCPECNFMFPTKQCFDLHLKTTAERVGKENISTCSSFKRCLKYGTRHFSDSECKNSTHKCYT